ncbi:MAG: primosomal protein N' [Solobacterium sp.]|nr:primosomal protein N' [Solobacterium sp.]
MRTVQCWIENPVRKLDQTYTYTCMEEVSRGCRVKIGFGNRTVTGFVDSVSETDETVQQLEERLGVKVKPVLEVIDRVPVLNEELYDLGLWMRDMTLSTAISCFQTMLPSKMKPRSRREDTVRERWVKVSDEEVKLTPKQLQAYEYIREKGEVRYSELRNRFPNQAKALLDKNALVSYLKEKEARDIRADIAAPSYDLTPMQKQAMDTITGSDDAVYLLCGVTGSGKTEIYLRLAQEAIEKGRQVLILVPEIALTPQMIERVSKRFGSGLAIYHSRLNPQEKYEQYRLVSSGRAGIVVGTRSAVFMPFSDLGLIIMDEEHDTSYKQDNQPCYHCRDIAIQRGRHHHCKVILGSATPSLESYARALKNVYHLVTMDERINDSLPDVTTIPLRDTIRGGQSYILSDALREKISARLQADQQVILLLNRRGYHANLRCRSCQDTVKCPHCDISMSWHQDIRKLKCHMCGMEMTLPRKCPSCGSTEGYSAGGIGTQKLEDEIRSCFPMAQVLRMDADTTSKKDSHEKILTQFGRGEADILAGTQMIAKGLDYPNVTLVGIINGDEGLQRTDFRSCEMTFDLLMQASGRSGRGEKEGEVVLQVYDPAHYAVQCAARQDYLTFFKNEMKFRHAGQYPPYVYMISLTSSGKTQEEAEKITFALMEELEGSFKKIGVITLLKIRDRCRSRVILKGKDLDEMRDAVRKFLKESTLNLNSLKIDVNPIYLD